MMSRKMTDNSLFAHDNNTSIAIEGKALAINQIEGEAKKV